MYICELGYGSSILKLCGWVYNMVQNSKIPFFFNIWKLWKHSDFLDYVCLCIPLLLGEATAPEVESTVTCTHTHTHTLIHTATSHSCGVTMMLDSLWLGLKWLKKARQLEDNKIKLKSKSQYCWIERRTEKLFWLVLDCLLLHLTCSFMRSWIDFWAILTTRSVNLIFKANCKMGLTSKEFQSSRRCQNLY